MYTSTRAALSYRVIVFKSRRVTAATHSAIGSLLKLARHALRPPFVFLFNFSAFLIIM